MMMNVAPKRREERAKEGRGEERRERHTDVWSENLKDDLGVDGKVVMKLILQK